jgi:FKBP-type peptidyl-prolyl cis-trans isomerase FkpA
MLKKFVFGLIIIALFNGCSKEEKCDYDECAVRAPASEIQAVQNYLASQNITNAVQHCSGLFYVIDDMGTGKHPNSCSDVNVTYKGTFTNGTVFDQGTIGFGLDGLILGWRNGIPLVKAGGKIHLYVPPTLGYGSQTYRSIPGNSILVFEIILNSVQ